MDEEAELIIRRLAALTLADLGGAHGQVLLGLARQWVVHRIDSPVRPVSIPPPAVVLEEPEPDDKGMDIEVDLEPPIRRVTHHVSPKHVTPHKKKR